MRILILSQGLMYYSTRVLMEACEKRGHVCEIIDSMDCALQIEEMKPAVYHEGRSLDDFDAVIPRIGPERGMFGPALLRQFEQMGVFTLSGSSGVMIARDKLRQLQIFSRRDIGIPSSAFVYKETDIKAALERIGGAPLIIKLLDGAGGKGVMLAESNATARAIISTLQLANRTVLLQRFLSESQGSDIRAIVVGDEVVGAMRRSAQKGEFRSNVKKGGSTEVVELSPEYERTAIRAAHVVGLRFAGVDMLETSEGPKVMEINASPGLEGIQKATGVDIADKVVAYLEEQVRFPDVDIGERLALGKGFVVCDVPVGQGSSLAEHTIGQEAFAEQGIRILSVTRQEVIIPNPAGDFQIQEGDTLLCYGKKASISALLPGK